MAYPTVIGCGCLLGAGGASQLHAAEWLLQPTLSSEIDYDSSRSVLPDTPGSEEAVLSADLRLQRVLENTQLMLEPHFDLRRFSDSVWGPGDDRSVTGAFSWTGERAQFSLNGSFSDQNTLTTELLETGIIDTHSRRRSETASSELDLLRTEEHVFFAQLSYLGSTYSGPAEAQLPGYRYESAALGERFTLSEHLTLSASAFGDILHSEAAGASSHEAGVQLGLSYTHSERLSFDLEVGESRRVLQEPVLIFTSPFSYELGFKSTASTGTNVSASATRKFERGTVSLSYLRNLTPYGNGFLVQREQINASASRSFTEYLSLDLHVIRVQNNESTVRLGLDRRYYDNAGLGLNWRVSETWTLRPDISTSWSQPIGSDITVREWRAALTATWAPVASVMSR